MTDLFSQSEPLSRADKMRITRKLTNKLTKDAIDWINDTGQFKVHRQNNIPSYRLGTKKMEIPTFNEQGKPCVLEIEVPEIFHKKNNVKVTLLDIAGFRVSDGVHLEIEVKYGKDTLTKEQKERIKSIQAAGGISFSISSLETLQLQLKPFMQERKPAF